MASPSQQELCEDVDTPTRITRIQEKEQLQGLNDRLMSYITQVRTMKETNYRLESELQICKEQLGQEADSVKALYEAELADARSLIDETAKEKARQQIMASKNASRIEELEAEVKSLKDELERATGRLSMAERHSASLEAERKSAIADKGRLSKQVRDLEAELEELRGTVEALKETLEAETLSKVDLQNHIQSLKEEMVFKRKVYEEEIASLRLKMTEVSVESSEYSTVFHAQKFEEAIDELREKSEYEMGQYRIELEAAFKDRIAALETQNNRDVTTINRLNAEIRKMSTTCGDSNSEISKLQKLVDKLECTVRDKDAELSTIRQSHNAEVSRLLEELRELRASYELKMREYQELMDVKINLDQEIATYRALLHEEETRLNLTPTPREKRTRSHIGIHKSPSPKKPRLETDYARKASVKSTSTGYIQISDIDPEGRFVQIKNLSNQVESLGGFKIVHKVEGEEEQVFRFHHKSKLQGGTSVTVWASKADGAAHNPPTDIIWRGLDIWGCGEKTVTELTSNTGSVVATFIQRSGGSPSKNTESSASFETVSSSASRSFPHLPESEEEEQAGSSYTTTTTTTRRYMGGGQQQQQQVGEEHMFHQKGDPRGKCRVS